MNDRTYRMDSHKLYWHLDRLQAWAKGERIAPIHIDVGLSKGCNIKCHYCFGALQGNLYKQGRDQYFQREPLLRYMRDAGKVGVRSMAFIGEAEPLLNPHVYEAIDVATQAGVDIGLGTNGVLFDIGAAGEKALEQLIWIRFNISAASDDAYRRLHGSKDFSTFVEKVKFCVATKAKKGLPVTIGFQMVLTPQDVGEVLPLTELAKNLGIDYFEIKHCGDTKQNDLGIYKKLDQYDEFTEVLEKAETQGSDHFKVIVKWNNISKKGRRTYDCCLGAPFLLYSSGDGKLYHCGLFFSHREAEFRLGDLNTESFADIVNGDRYWEIMRRIENGIDVHKECYTSCKTNAINDFLFQLKQPPKHINFI
ncbi:MAG: radical SAM/SPASM domain-containing protein [Desulfobacteraceae bacterium]|nr:radical SAM/SPASM domain-containing protein [Desulfobacteraceae bacterium]